MILLLFLIFVAFCAGASTTTVAFLQIAGVGLLLAVAVFGLSCALQGHSMKKEWMFFRAAPFLVAYGVALLIDIIKANGLVFAAIVTGKKPEGVITSFHSGMTSAFGNMLLANAITLTPGTITVHLEGDSFTVHCLFCSYGTGLAESIPAKMAKRIDRLMSGADSKKEQKEKK